MIRGRPAKTPVWRGIQYGSKLISILGLAFVLSNCSKDGGGGGDASPTTEPAASSGDSQGPILTIIVPSGLVAKTNTSRLLIQGECIEGHQIQLASPDGESQVKACDATGFTFEVDRTVDGTYSFLVSDITLSGIGGSDSSPIIPPNSGSTSLVLSGATSSVTGSAAGASGTVGTGATSGTGASSDPMIITWIRDTVPPSSVVFSSGSPVYTATSNLNLAGSCEIGAHVNISGDDVDGQDCVDGTFSFATGQQIDGIYSYLLSQTDEAGNVSLASSFQWIRDTVAPAAPTLASPGSNPYTSSGSSLTLAGGCEDGALVSWTGAANGSVACSSNSYSINLSESADGSYSLSIVQTDLAGNASPAASFQWNRLSSSPAAPLVTSPVGSPYYSSGSSLTLQGSCVTGNTVNLSGVPASAVTGGLSKMCTSSSFQFVVNESTDATYPLSLTQTNLGNVTSASTSFVWVRDTQAPVAPTILSPASSPFSSSGSSLVVSGNCETGATVILSGGASNTQSCTGGAFSFTVSQSADGTYFYSLVQKDLADNVSSASSFQWIRDTVAPASPGVTSPNMNPYTSSGSTLNVSGTCENGATVSWTGATSGSAACSSNSYSINLSESVDGSYSLSIVQTDLAGNASPAATFQWNRLASIPPAPIITSPASSPYYSSGSSLILQGSCVTGNTVNVSGVSASAVTGGLSTMCSSNSFQFVINESTDATYDLALSQTSVSNVASASTSFVWVRDTQAPLAPAIVSPGSNPFISGDTTLTILGTCETGATVSWSGAASGSSVCPVSATFSLSFTENVDGSYAVSMIQTDAASNASASTSFSWVRDTTIPPTPTISAPSTNPYYSNSSSLILSGTCQTGDTLTLSGVLASEVAGNSLTQSCTTGSYSYTINKSADGSYSLSVYQTNASSIDSSTAGIIWVRDTSTPPTPTLVSPGSNPYTSGDTTLTITGGCESGATVNFSGAMTGSVSCSGSTYSRSITENTDGTYNVTMNQVDRAGNTSGNLVFQWTRNSSIPATPTITSPASNPYLSSSNSLTLSGGCISGDMVTLGGNVVAGDVTYPSGSLTQTCSVVGSFSYTIQKTVDGSYSLTVMQTSPALVNSSTASFTWRLDTTPPVTTIGSKPATFNLASSASLTFSSNETGSTFQCKLTDNTTSTVVSPYTTCVSPITYSGLGSSDSYTFSVRATDSAGNVEATPSSYSWTQAAYNTVALYHFDTATGVMVDSSKYTSGNNNGLTDSSTTSVSSITGFSQARGFASASSQYVSVADTASQELLTSVMTVEAQVHFNSLPSSGSKVVIASKMGGSGQYGWEFGLLKCTSSKYCTYFTGSLNGTTVTTVQSSSKSISTSSGVFYHMAVTWNKGTVNFFINGSSFGSKTIGTAGSAILRVPTSTPLRLGATGQSGSLGSFLNGILDEVRIMQIIPNSVSSYGINLNGSSYTVPTSPYTGSLIN